jgi:HD-GYP domain-containing protein (c-di-GMP phosphodiesterase class II)
MTSNRSYRKGLTVDEAFQALEKGKGTQFDPQLIDVLQNVKGEFRNIYQKANDPIKEFESLTDLF